MKPLLRLVLTGFVLLLLGNCKKLDKLTQFNIDYYETVVIPSSTGINLPFNIISPDIATQSESVFASNDTRKDLIESIVLKKLDLTVKSPQGGTFSFLKSIEIYLNADGLPETKVAWKESVPANAGNYLELDVSGSDLQEFVKKDKFTLKLKTVTDEIITSDYSIQIHSMFYVDAKVLGQ